MTRAADYDECLHPSAWERPGPVAVPSHAADLPVVDPPAAGSSSTAATSPDPLAASDASVASWMHERPSLIAQRAYDIYRQRRATGVEVLPSQFCQEFPANCRYALRRLLSVHCALVEDHPSWLAELQEGLVEDEPPWPTIGDDWLGYQIDEQIGQGGLARVYLASELSAGRRRVVLKITPFETGEGHLQSNLSHESIVPVLTVRRDEVSGLTAIVMPYWGQATLQDVRDHLAAGEAANAPPPDLVVAVARQRCAERSPVLPRTPSAPQSPAASFRQVIARLGIQLAEALAYTHERGILHRDLKPTNILLTPDGRALLMDFNLSATVEHGALLLGGTIPYMPPELLQTILQQTAVDRNAVGTADRATDCSPAEAGDDVPTVRGFQTTRDGISSPLSNPATADPRSDLFSLGVIFYELLCGRLPFGEPDLRWPLARQARWMLDQQRPVALSSAGEWDQLEPQWQLVLTRCLAPDVRQRFADARQLLDALRLLDNPPPVVAQLRPGRSPATVVRRWRWPAAVLASAALFFTATATDPLEQPAFRTAPAVAGYRPDPPLVFPVRELLKWKLPAARPRSRDDGLALRNLDAIMSSVREGDGDRATLTQAVDQLLQLLPKSGAYGADVRSCLGFCRSRLEEHQLAAEDYRSALNADQALRFADRARTHNNLAYSLQRVGEADHAREHAELALQRAIGDEEGIAAARVNRATCEIRRLERELRKPSRPATPEMFQGVIDDLESARALRGQTASFHYLALRIYATADSAVASAEWRDQAKRAMTAAIEYGLDRRVIEMSSPPVRNLAKSYPLPR